MSHLLQLRLLYEYRRHWYKYCDSQLRRSYTTARPHAKSTSLYRYIGPTSLDYIELRHSDVSRTGSTNQRASLTSSPCDWPSVNNTVCGIDAILATPIGRAPVRVHVCELTSPVNSMKLFSCYALASPSRRAREQWLLSGTRGSSDGYWDVSYISIILWVIDVNLGSIGVILGGKRGTRTRGHF